jgi:hypothetical protein
VSSPTSPIGSVLIRSKSELSATYNSKPWQLTLANQVKEALQARKDWIAADWVKTEDEETGREVKLLDFASGTGNCSNALES